MRRFFFITVIICFLFCSCVAKPQENTLPVKAENKIFTGVGRDFFVVVKQTAQGRFNIDNSSYSYNYLGYSVQLYPINLNAERPVKVIFQGNEYDFSSGNFSAFSEGVAVIDSLVICGENEEEIYLEEQAVDCENIIKIFFERFDGFCDEEIGGAIEIKFILDYRGVFVFCGYSENGVLLHAALFNGDGVLVTDIALPYFAVE